MTEDELLIAFKKEMQNFKLCYVERMEACNSVEELDSLRKIWLNEINVINRAIFKKD